MGSRTSRLGPTPDLSGRAARSLPRSGTGSNICNLHCAYAPLTRTLFTATEQYLEVVAPLDWFDHATRAYPRFFLGGFWGGDLSTAGSGPEPRRAFNALVSGRWCVWAGGSTRSVSRFVTKVAIRSGIRTPARVARHSGQSGLQSRRGARGGVTDRHRGPRSFERLMSGGL